MSDRSDSIKNRVIPEDWLKEKGKNKHETFIKFHGKKIKRR